jgi:hypothetical protein
MAKQTLLLGKEDVLVAAKNLLDALDVLIHSKNSDAF